MMARISPGSIQLFVGPASASSTEQMNVWSSTRATSEGSDTHQYESGFLSSLTKVPAATSSFTSRSYSASEPSTQWIESGCVRAATSATHAASRACRVGALVSGLSVERGVLSVVVTGLPFLVVLHRPPGSGACVVARGGGTRGQPTAAATVSDRNAGVRGISPQ